MATPYTSDTNACHIPQELQMRVCSTSVPEVLLIEPALPLLLARLHVRFAEGCSLHFHFAWHRCCGCGLRADLGQRARVQPGWLGHPNGVRRSGGRAVPWMGGRWLAAPRRRQPGRRSGFSGRRRACSGAQRPAGWAEEQWPGCPPLAGSDFLLLHSTLCACPRMKFSCASLQHPCCAAGVQEVACIVGLTAGQAGRNLQRALGRRFDAKAGALQQPVAVSGSVL